MSETEIISPKELRKLAKDYKQFKNELMQEHQAAFGETAKDALLQNFNKMSVENVESLINESTVASKYQIYLTARKVAADIKSELDKLSFPKAQTYFMQHPREYNALPTLKGYLPHRLRQEENLSQKHQNTHE